jgi:hypothetical protein
VFFSALRPTFILSRTYTGSRRTSRTFFISAPRGQRQKLSVHFRAVFIKIPFLLHPNVGTGATLSVLLD